MTFGSGKLYGTTTLRIRPDTPQPRVTVTALDDDNAETSVEIEGLGTIVGEANEITGWLGDLYLRAAAGATDFNLKGKTGEVE